MNIKDIQNKLILISYDIKSSQTEVKKALMKLEYFEKNKPMDEDYTLSNTTLFHHKKSTKEAIQDLKSVCTGLSVYIEKAIASKANEPAIVRN